jgi:hypothetical protein
MYLLAIGVARFRNSPENNLRFTDDDARAFAGFYETQRRTMFKEVEVRSLTNEQATRDGIHKALGWLREKVRPDDQVVAYVSSHGFPGRKEGTFFFAPADFRADDLENTCVGWDRLLTELDALPCQRVVLVLDTCHSGGAVLQIVRGINPVNELLRNAREDGTFALVSSLPSEVSWVLPEHKQSAFTLAVLEGLRQGKAGSEPDGILTLERLFAYARLRVPETGVRNIPGTTDAGPVQPPRAHRTGKCRSRKYAKGSGLRRRRWPDVENDIPVPNTRETNLC